jgi:putative protease
MVKPKSKRPEILAPAGDISCALAAFAAGADGVYLGLKDFSARKSASNFSLETLRRLKGVAGVQGRKIYVAINTVVLETEMEALFDLLVRLEWLGVDGIIIQDLGVLKILKEYFPGLAIHASTQMAAGSHGALSLLEREGVRRVILPRETPLEMIREFKKAHSGLELEVFIHGALCYSWSGLCLASGLLLNRSGNRGECAQLCRNYYSVDGENRYPFSCNDLFLGEDILKLADAGVSSLKIEGRMKGAAYVSRVVALYRAILERAPDVKKLADAASLTFARKSTKGYFANSKGENLVDEIYPGHRGLSLGKVLATKGEWIELSPAHDLHMHDSLLYFHPTKTDQVVRFTIFGLKTAQGIRPPLIRAGTKAWVKTDKTIPPVGQEIFLISTKNISLAKGTDEKELPLRMPIIPLTIECRRTGMVFRIMLDEKDETFEVETPPLEGQGPGFEQTAQNLWLQAGKSFFVASPVSVKNETGFTNLFVPPSVFKKIKNDFYFWLDGVVEERIKQKVGLFNKREIATSTNWSGGNKLKRKELNPLSDPGMPFASLVDLDSPANFVDFHGFKFVPLPPVLVDENLWGERLHALVQGYPEIKFAIGINNIGQVPLVEKLEKYSNVFSFLDFYTYLANTWAAEFYAWRLNKILFGFFWVEGNDEEFSKMAATAVPLVVIEDTLSLPLFYSRSCSQREKNSGRCLKDCPKRFSWTVKNVHQRFRVEVKDCVTFLFRE